MGHQGERHTLNRLKLRICAGESGWRGERFPRVAAMSIFQTITREGYDMKTVRSSILLIMAATLMLLTGCTSNSRLDARFDTEAPGSPPPSSPGPTPPNDQLNWRTAFVTTTLVVRSAGDNWVRLQPLKESTASPDDRRVFLIAVTDPFTTNPVANIRGSVRLRLDNLGTIGIGFRPLQGEQTLDFIGGIELSNFLPPANGGVFALKEFRGDRLADPFGLPSSGQIASYTSGQVIDINWTLDQASRTFSASVLGGPSQSCSYSDLLGGVSTVPIQRIMLQFWMQKSTSNTVGFIDNLLAEEYR
jgi:hypothetical protein